MNTVFCNSNKPNLLLFSGIILFSCQPDIGVPSYNAGTADVSKVIYLGDDYLAGVQNGAVTLRSQEYSIAAFLNNSFSGGIDHPIQITFNQPIIPDNEGIGFNNRSWQSDFLHRSYLSYPVDCKGVPFLAPVSQQFNLADASSYLTTTSSTVTNFSAPSLTTSDILSTQAGMDFSSGGNLFYHRFASSPGTSTVNSDVRSANGTFSVVWLGIEDIYRYARNGGYNTSIPPSSQFADRLDSILSGLPAGVIATIPPINSLPFYTTIPWNGAAMEQSTADSLNDIYILSGLPDIHFTAGANPFILDDANATGGYRQLLPNELITLEVPLDSMKCNFMGVIFSTIPDRYVIDTSEINIINLAIAQYNSVINTKAQQYNFAVVDMYSFFNNAISGIIWNGADYTTEFVSGGFFSLDGYTPNEKGSAMIANEFIKSINTYYKATLPIINCLDCNGIIFP